MGSSFLFITLFSLAILHAFGSDSHQLQDFCVADLSFKDLALLAPDQTWHRIPPQFESQNLAHLHAVFVNGFCCKNPSLVTENDFFFSGLDRPGNTSYYAGSNVTEVTARNLPGLNTFGISLSRMDFAPGGRIPPHYHPRASELLVVIEGALDVGFVTSNNRFFVKNLKKGDVYVFPRGLVHELQSSSSTGAVAFSGLSSQNPGAVFVITSIFGSKPAISPDVLAKAFHLDKKTVERLQAQFSGGH